jgi:hypothetical protein
MRWTGRVARVGERRRARRVLVGRPEGKRPLGRLTRRWEDNIKINLQEEGCVAWAGWIWLRVRTGGKLCKCGNLPLGSIKFGEFLV